jgi:hypothetical protein
MTYLKETVMKYLINLFRTPSAAVLAQRELEDAKRELLHYQSIQECSKRMSEYQSDRIRRLTSYLAGAL